MLALRGGQGPRGWEAQSLTVLDENCNRGWSLGSPRRASCNRLHLLYRGNWVPLPGSPLLWCHVIPLEHQVPVKTCQPRKENEKRRSLTPGFPTRVVDNELMWMELTANQPNNHNGEKRRTRGRGKGRGRKERKGKGEENLVAGGYEAY